MGLNRQDVEIVLSGGVDTKTNPHLVSAGKLAALENYAHKGGALQRRPGSRSLYSSTTATGGTPPGSDAMLGLFGGKLVMRDRYRLYPYDSRDKSLPDSGILLQSGVAVPVPSLWAQAKRIRGAPFLSRQAFASSATANGLSLYGWTSTLDGSMTVMVLGENGEVIGQPASLGTGAYDFNNSLDTPISGPVPVAFRDTVGVIYGTSAGRYIRIVDPATGRLGPELVLSTGSTRWGMVDAALNPDNSVALVSWEGTASTSLSLTLTKIKRDGSVALTTALVTGVNLTALTSGGVGAIASPTVAVATGGNICVFYRKNNAGSGEVHGIVRDQSHASVSADSLIDFRSSSYVVNRLVASPSPTNSGQVLLGYDFTETATSYITASFIQSDGASMSTKYDIPGGPLVSKPFSMGQGSKAGYVAVAQGFTWKASATDVIHSSLQSTVLVMDLNGEPVARLLQGSSQYNGPGATSALLSRTRPTTVSLVTLDDGSPSVRFLVHAKSDQAEAELAATLTEMRLIQDVVGGRRLSPLEYGGSLYLPGALPRQFDGVNLHEVGFNFYPEGVSVALNSAGSGMDDGTHLVAVVYEWTDAAGEFHQSAPSVPYSITTDASHRTITVTIPTIRVTDKLSTAVQLAVYVGPVNGSTLYRVNAIDNDPTVKTLTLVLSNSDADIQSGVYPILYTTGGVAENVGLPACHHLAKHQERLVATLLDGSIAFSNVRIPGYAPRFNETFVIPTLDAVATASMDGRLIIFYPDRVSFSSGQGPDELGGSGSYSPPQTISVETGCIVPQSVVETPIGVMFRGKRGIYLVQRDLSVVYQGADVEGLTGAITSAVHISGRQEVRFNQSDPPMALVFNYGQNGQWGTITPRQIASAVEYGDGVAWASGSDLTATVLSVSDFTAVSNGGTAIEAAFETGWLRVGKITGFQRVWRLALRGTYWGPSLVSVYVAYDGDPEWVAVIRKQTIDLNLEAGQPIHLEHHFRKQKCRAIKLRVVDDGGGEDPSRGVDWLAIGLELGVRPGLFKTSSLQLLGKAEGSAGS